MSPSVTNIGWLGDGSHRGQVRQAWTAVGLPPRYPGTQGSQSRQQMFSLSLTLTSTLSISPCRLLTNFGEQYSLSFPDPLNSFSTQLLTANVKQITIAVSSAAFLHNYRKFYLSSNCVTQTNYATVTDNYAVNSMPSTMLTHSTYTLASLWVK